MFKYIVSVVLIALIWAIVLVLRLPDIIAIVATVVIVAILVTLVLVRRYRALKAAKDIERALNAQAAAQLATVRPEQQAEIQAMQAEFSKAIGSLKTSKLGKSGADALYSLPWYMIIGPPGTGKSTALRNSGLQFPYLSQAGGGVRGVGGTRNCEWWLTNDGVILDTAGRYTTEEDDRDEWFSFLDMLKRNRPRKPVNGIMVAVSVGDLGGAHENDVVAMAKKIRERTDEVMGRLAMIVPVYVLFTKCDLIPGFVEMFGDLKKQERGQVWGFTVPLAQRVSAPGELFTERFDELSRIIEQMAYRRMPQERKIDSREQIYVFPQQFEFLRRNLSEFVGTLFQENVYQGTPIMRGVYFTSGTQEGRPIDRVMASMAEAFGIRGRASTGALNQVTEPKSYFLRDVFANVVFPDQDVAARSKEEIRRERNRRYYIAAGAFGFAVLLSVLPAYSYMQNVDLVRTTGQIAQAAHTPPAPAGQQSASSLSLVEPLRERVDELRDNHDRSAPFSMRLGMYQGNELYDAARDLYTSTLRRAVIQPVEHAGEGDLDQFGRRYEALETAPTSDEHERFYNELKLHILLTQPREHGEPGIDAQEDWLNQQIVGRWAQLTSVTDPVQRGVMAANVSSYLSLMAVQPSLAFDRNVDAVRRARIALTRIPRFSLAIEQLIAEVERDGYGIHLGNLIGQTIIHVRATGYVRGAFTRRGWEERIRGRLSQTLDTITGEPWVLGSNPSAAQALDRDHQLQQLRSQYFASYIEEWRRFLDTIRVDRPADAAAALGMLQELTGGEPPPFSALMRGVAYNVHLEEPVAQAAGGLVASARAGIVARIGRGLAEQEAPRSVRRAPWWAGGSDSDQRLYTRQDVEDEFKGFTSFGVPPAPPPAPPPGAAAPPPPAPTAVPLDSYQAQLALIRDAVVTFNENPNSPAAPLLTALQTARTTVQGLISGQEERWKPRFQALFWPPVQWVTERARGALGSGTGSRFCSAVVVPFERTLHSRYPFDPAGQDAAIADVADFYRPERGKLWAFYGDALHADVPRVGDHFDFAQNLGANASDVYQADLLRFLERSQDVATVLFPTGSNDPLVQFEVRIRPTPTIATLTFQVDGQTVDYDNGPEQWHSMRWPGEGHDSRRVDSCAR